MKNLFALSLVIALPLLSTSVLAQKKTLFTSDDVEVVVGPVTAMDKSSKLMGFVAEDNGEFVHYARTKDSHRFERFDAAFKSMAVKDIPFTEEKGVEEFNELPQLLSGALMLVVEEKNSKAKTTTCWLTRIDPKTLQVMGERKKLFQFSGERYQKHETLPEVLNSADNSKILVSMPLWKDDFETSGHLFSVYDKEMNLIWEKELANSFDRENVTTGFGDVIKFEDDGTVRFWAGCQKTSDWLLVSISGNEIQSVKFVHPRDNTKYYSSSMLRYIGNGDVVRIGYYTHKDGEQQSQSRMEKAYGNKVINGIYLYSFNIVTGKVKNQWYYEFPIDVAMRYGNNGQKERAETDAAEGKSVGIKELEIVEFTMLPNGGIVISGETKYKIRMTDNTIFHNHNIYVTYINPLMEFEWCTVIPKHQVSTMSDRVIASERARGHGFQLVTKGNKLYYLYNDSPKNLAKDWNGSMVHPYIGSNCPVTLATIDVSDPESMTRQQAWIQEQVGGGLFMFGEFTFGYSSKPTPITYGTAFENGVFLYRLADNSAKEVYLKMTVK